MLGFCTGALAAAAVSASSSLSELLPIAVQTVSVAFRLGLTAQKLCDHLEVSSEDKSRSWSVVIGDLDSETALTIFDDFCKSNVGQQVLFVLPLLTVVQ